MVGRRVLIIGSQCNALNRLTFLPAVAERLHALMTNPGPGQCVGVPVTNGTPGLLLDPTVDEAKRAIRTAIEGASKSGETLILAYIGHGEFPDERMGDFYLMPTDATKPTSDGAIHLAKYIEELIRDHPVHGGLVVLLDACYGGTGVWQAMAQWAQSQRGNIGFELITSTDDRRTANAPLTRALIGVLERGDPEIGEHIHCRDVHRRLLGRDRPPQHVAYNANDARLYLARNLARDPGDVFWKDSPGRAQILAQTAYFQPTPQLAALVDASRSHPVVVLTGEAGAGKTTLAAALARPELTGGLVPAGFAQAISILTQTTDEGSLANDLERQLRHSLFFFKRAVEEFGRAVPLPERERLDFLRKKVLGPLAYLACPPEVWIVLDGYNQLPDGTRSAVGAALASRPSHVRLVLTAHPDTPDCPPAHTLPVGRTPCKSLNHYLTARRVPEAAHAAILDRAQDNWLITRLLADAVLADLEIDLSSLPGTVDEAYATRLGQAGAAAAWYDQFRPVLGPLAVVGSGPVLPFPLLARASATLGGPESEEAVREVLAKLRGLVVRRDAGTPGEHVGLFHPTLADYLLSPAASAAGYAIDALAAHRAMVQAINALAPSSKHNPYDPLHRYAFLREADHLWAIGDVDRTLDCLMQRESNDPRENLDRWRPWPLRFQSVKIII